MAPPVDSATLNVQPRLRRAVYESLAELPEGRSVKDLLGNSGMAETELRETLRKLDAAGLARRVKGTWRAVPLETAERRSQGAPGPAPDSPQDA